MIYDPLAAPDANTSVHRDYDRQNQSKSKFSLQTPVTEDEYQDAPSVFDEDISSLTSLNEVDFDGELLNLYKRTRLLAAQAETDKQMPYSQRAAAFKTHSATMQTIIKAQESLHSVERMKITENVLIETLKAFPDLQEMFLKQYAEKLEEAHKASKKGKA